MDLKQKKTIFWSVVITLLFSTSLFTWFTFEGINQKGIWRGISDSVFLTLLLCSLPSVIFYRLLIGRIKVGDNWTYYLWILFLGLIIFTVLQNRLGEYLFNPPRELIFLFELVILVYIIHKILKRFVFDFEEEKEEKQ